MFVQKTFITISAISLFLLSNHSVAQSSETWFQTEFSIFRNESALDRSEELWQPGRTPLDYPQRIDRLATLMDLLMIDELRPQTEENQQQELQEVIPSADAEEFEAPPLSLYPEMKAEERLFKFYDFDREALVHLPNSQSDFQQSNRAIERSADHRLLFHGLWRQPVLAEDQARSIYISGGQQFGKQKELQGSVTIRFNDNADRVVIDADLWISEFSNNLSGSSSWELPDIPNQFENQGDSPDGGFVPTPTRLFHMQQSRDMRSTEFHYLDHPAMGIVILVKPYEVPLLPIPELFQLGSDGGQADN